MSSFKKNLAYKGYYWYTWSVRIKSIAQIGLIASLVHIVLYYGYMAYIGESVNYGQTLLMPSKEEYILSMGMVAITVSVFLFIGLALSLWDAYVRHNSARYLTIITSGFILGFLLSLNYNYLGLSVPVALVSLLTNSLIKPKMILEAHKGALLGAYMGLDYEAMHRLEPVPYHTDHFRDKKTGLLIDVIVDNPTEEEPVDAPDESEELTGKTASLETSVIEDTHKVLEDTHNALDELKTVAEDARKSLDNSRTVENEGTDETDSILAMLEAKFGDVEPMSTEELHALYHSDIQSDDFSDENFKSLVSTDTEYDESTEEDYGSDFSQSLFQVTEDTPEVSTPVRRASSHRKYHRLR